MHKIKWLFIVISIIPQIIFAQSSRFHYNGILRTYIVHTPPAYSEVNQLPLVIGLHGYASNALSFQNYCYFKTMADEENFIAVFPNAVAYNYRQIWNAGGSYEWATCKMDDVGFISALIDTMIHTYNVDATKIYVTGFSNGSIMCYRLAAELSDKIAAIGPVSGQMAYEYCNPECSVPIIHFHGLSDEKVEFDGDTIGSLFLPPVDSTLSKWRKFNKCSEQYEIIYNEGDIRGKRWKSLNGDGDIELYTIAHLGHKWPTISNAGISATEIMWEFFEKQQKKMNSTKIESNATTNSVQYHLFQNYPNPFNPSTTIQYSLSRSSHVRICIYNTLGQQIKTLEDKFQPAGEYKITWHPERLPSGIYFYKMQVGEFSVTRKLIFQK